MPDDDQQKIGDMVLTITTSGNRYDMRIGDFSAMDELDYKRITGAELMTPFMSGELNSAMIAGLVWLTRRRFGEKQLRFEKVAQEFKWADLDTIEFSNGSDSTEAKLPEVVTNPEA